MVHIFYIFFLGFGFFIRMYGIRVYGGFGFEFFIEYALLCQLFDLISRNLS